MVNVIIVFPKIEEAKSIKNLLIRNGISVTKVCTTRRRRLRMRVTMES